MTDTKITLLLCLACAVLASIGLTGLAHGETSTYRVLAALPVHTSDYGEDPDLRRVRLTDIAADIDAVGETKLERAWLIMTADRESHLAEYVDRDGPKCRTGQGGRCDSGRAFSLWQVHGMSRTSTRRQAAARAIEVLRKSANYCRVRGYDYWIGGTAGYARGNSCVWGEAEERVAEMREIVRGL